MFAIVMHIAMVRLPWRKLQKAVFSVDFSIHTLHSIHIQYEIKYFLYFYHVSACITMSVIFFSLAIASVRKTFEGSNMIRKITDKNRELRVYLKLLILMGLTWAIGIIAPWADTPAVWFLLITFNASQGMSIFIAFVFGVRILRRVARKCCCHLIHGATTEIRDQDFSNNITTSIS